MSSSSSSSSDAATIRFASVQTREHGAILLDVRSREEFRSGHIANAMHIKCPPLSFTSSPRDRDAKLRLCKKLKQKIADVFPQRNIYIFLYCSDGRRAATAAAMLETFGYRNVAVLGGIDPSVAGANRALAEIASGKLIDPAFKMCHCSPNIIAAEI